MKIKKIFAIVAVLTFLQLLPLPLSLFNADFKEMLLLDVFGLDSSANVTKFLDNFVMVLSTLVVGLIFLLIGSMSFEDEAILRRLCFLYSIVWGFYCIPDLVAFIINDGMTPPAPIIAMGVTSYVLLLYGSKRGTA